MSNILLYHSNSGNTKLACDYLRKQLLPIKLDLVDIATHPIPDLDHYDAVGFATWTQFLDVPYFFRQFVEKLSYRNQQPAFILNTFGMMSGRTLKSLKKLLADRGFVIVAGHSFHMPESYPVYIIKGWDSADAPNPKELASFQQFVADLGQKLTMIESGKLPAAAKIKIGLFNSLMRPYSVEKARKQMGKLSVDSDLCTGCGTCQKVCLYHAVELDSVPVFNVDRCHGCWSCFNHCPQKAIFTDKIKGKGHYPQPIDQLVNKLDTV